MAKGKQVRGSESIALRGFLTNLLTALNEFSFSSDVLKETVKQAVKRVDPKFDFDAKYRANYVALSALRLRKRTRQDRRLVQLVDALIGSLESKKMKKAKNKILKAALRVVESRNEDAL
jgi:hypothetical protein